MKVIKGMRQYLAEGLRLEKSGDLAEATISYEKVVDRDPTNQEAVARLLIVYRKLKAYRKELAVIDNAIGAYKEKDKTIQESWLRAHPGAAGAGKAVLRSLGGGAVSAFATNSVANRLLKRKELVERKISDDTAKRKSVRPSTGGTSGKKQAARQRQTPRKKNKRLEQAKGKKPTKAVAARVEKHDALKLQRKATEQKRLEAKVEREEAEAARRKGVEYRRQQEKEEREAVAEARKKAVASRKAEMEAARAQQQVAKKAAAEANIHPTLFVIMLRYLVPLKQIDAEMHRHVAFLGKYYKSGQILISGRLVPRNGGVIIARSKDRDAAERMMKEDPFVRKKLASIDIVEFSASRIRKGWNNFSKGA